MLLIVGVVVVGIVVGLLTGGRLRGFEELHFRWWGLALVGLALQLVPVPSRPGNLDHLLAVGLLLASYVALSGFVVANIRVPGMVLMGVGFVLNLIVISANGGMPVSGSAIREVYGPGYERGLRDVTLHGGAKHHLEGSGDVLTPLADQFPIGGPVRQVYSVGDFISLAGVGWVMAAATKGKAAYPSREDRRSGRPREPDGTHLEDQAAE